MTLCSFYSHCDAPIYYASPICHFYAHFL